jgi:metal-responsive CopG/Arc/MetJ family transcriptional regulator
MKPIQVMFDEQLLARLDATPEVKKKGRSAVLRRAIEDYLRRSRRYAIAERYKQAYGESNGLGDEYSGWEEQGEWPDV